MTPIIDLHILTLPDTRRDWLAKCIDSLKDEPVNLWIVPGTPGHLGYSREQGFRRGGAPWMTFVDPDDLIVPGIFEKIVPLLVGNVAVYTDELLMDESGMTTQLGWSSSPELYVDDPRLKFCQVPGEPGHYMHHLLVLPRPIGFYGLCLPRFTPETFLIQHADSCGTKFVHLNEVGYYWRQHANQWHRRAMAA